MIEAFLWGAFGASSLVIGALLALRVHIGRRLLGLIMGFGAGVLISAVAYELVEEAFTTADGSAWVAAGIFAGALTYFGGDELISRMGGGGRKSMGGEQQEGTALAIVLGTILDGIPESAVIGLTLLQGGGVSAAVLAAVFLSNLPEAIAATSGLSIAGWAARRILGLWLLVAFISALASLAGYALFDGASSNTVAFVLSFAGGAILTMLAETMMPEAYLRGGKVVGLATTLGFVVAFGVSALD